MIRNVSGTLEEAAQRIAALPRREREELFNELFKYEFGNPATDRPEDLAEKRNNHILDVGV